jgi:hypothetical protein
MSYHKTPHEQRRQQLEKDVRIQDRARLMAAWQESGSRSSIVPRSPTVPRLEPPRPMVPRLELERPALEGNPIWIRMCRADFENFDLTSLKNLAHSLRIGTAGLTKSQICDKLNKDYEFQMTKSKNLGCVNPTSLQSVEPWNEVPNWKIFKIYEKNNTFCFLANEMLRHPLSSNPYTGTEFESMSRSAMREQIALHKNRLKAYGIASSPPRSSSSSSNGY